MPELLAPAGNFEKLRTAIRFGADAVYLSGKAFGMRASANNFSTQELRDAVALAHENGVRVYLAVNVMPHSAEYADLLRFFSEIQDVPLDALIIADLGVMSLAKRVLPHIAIHVSTQANVLSAEACRAYYDLGARRIVLARELTLEEIRYIRKNIPQDLELEAFVHGSMCISHSGRCLLSSYFTGRDANRGACTQPCRWQYRIRESRYELVEEKRPEEPIPILEENGETFFLSSRDTSMIDHVSELIDAGIDSFKIEGRIRSAYYVAVVTNTYRMAIDAVLRGEREPDPAWHHELDSVSHRPYHTGFYYDDPHKEPNITDLSAAPGERSYLARVLSYDKNSGVARLCQQNKFSVGDTVELLSPRKIGRPMTVEALSDADGVPITSVPHPQMEFLMKLPYEAEEGDIIRAPAMGRKV